MSAEIGIRRLSMPNLINHAANTRSARSVDLVFSVDDLRFVKKRSAPCLSFQSMETRLKILLAEDEWLTRTTVADSLAEAGFQVIEVDSAEEALALLREQAQDIRALVTDVRMGGPMDGIELAHCAARCWPWVALVLATAEAATRLENCPEHCKVIRKPFDPSWIAIEVKQILSVQPGEP